MDNGGNYNDDNYQIFNARVPAVIPNPSLPISVSVTRRFAVPYRWLLILVMFGSVAVGALAATLWPLENHDRKSGGVAMLPGRGNDVSNSGSFVGLALTADEVTTITLTTPSSSAEPIATKPITTESPTTDPVTTEPITIKPLIARPTTTEPPAQIARDGCRITRSGPQLVLSAPRTVLRSDEPASLGLTVSGAPDGTQLIICGFAARSIFSVGRALDENTWTVPASMIADATIMPPRGFVGPMDLSVMLVNTDESLADLKTLHLQWLPETPASPQTPTPPRSVAKLDSLLNYGAHLKTTGNLAEARQIFSRVAQTGDPRGAFMLAETYDPIALAKRQLLPADSDLELARIWYRKASDLGSREALGRLERLTNW